MERSLTLAQEIIDLVRKSGVDRAVAGTALKVAYEALPEDIKYDLDANT